MDIIRESGLQHIKAVYGNQIFHSVDKGNISVCAEKSIADVLVFSQNPKDIFYKGQAVFSKRAYRVGVNGVPDFSGQFVFNGMEQIVDVCIVQIKGRAVNIHFVYQFFYSNLFDAFLLHELCQPQFQLIFCFSYTAVSFLCHGKSPFFCRILKKYKI